MAQLRISELDDFSAALLSYVEAALRAFVRPGRPSSSRFRSNTPPPPAKQKLDYISKIEEYDKASMKKNYEISFSYDSQKRLISFEETYPGTNSKKVYNGTLTYADKEVILNYTNNKYQTNLIKPTEIRLTLDAKEKVKQLKD